MIQINGTADLARRNIGILPLYILISFFGSWLLITLCNYLISYNNNFIIRIFEKIGRYSIIMLCTHQVLFTILQLLDYKLLSYAIQKTGEFEGFIMAILITMITYLLIPICTKYFGWSFGISRTKE